MDSSRFDAFTRSFSSRLSRRTALRGLGGTGLAALGGAMPMRVAAQDNGTPDPTSPGADQEFLFVQTAKAGTWAAKEGEEGVYTLTLTGATANTIYFSDRPERIVGTAPTTQFLDGLGFPSDNPPNAALVAQTDDGEDVLVVELFNPVYTEDFGPDGDVSLRYDARVLENYQEEGLQFAAGKQDDSAMPNRFGSASLFIDDCADAPVFCLTPAGQITCSPIGDFKSGYCWHWEIMGCVPCHNIDEQCNERFSGCNGQCKGMSYIDLGRACGRGH